MIGILQKLLSCKTTFSKTKQMQIKFVVGMVKCPLGELDFCEVTA